MQFCLIGFKKPLINKEVSVVIQECELELERTRRALSVTTAELAGCMGLLPSPQWVDAQYAMDGLSAVLIVWGLARLVWDLSHRHPSKFPVDR